MRTRAVGSLVLAGLRVLGKNSQSLEYTSMCAPLCQRFSSGVLMRVGESSQSTCTVFGWATCEKLTEE